MKLHTVSLLIKSKINEGATSQMFPVLDVWLKKFSDRFYIYVYVFSFVPFIFMSWACIGLACENKIQMSSNSSAVSVINFVQYPLILLLLGLFLKMLLPAGSNNGVTLINTTKIHFHTPNDRLKFLKQALFYQGFGFRVLLSSIVAIPLTIRFYFDVNILLNTAIAIVMMMCAVLLLNRLEVLLLYLSSFLKINASLSSLFIFAAGIVPVTFTRNIATISAFSLVTTVFLLILSSFLISSYLRKQL